MRAMPNPDWTPYQALGDEGVVRLVDRFYHHMDTLPEAAEVRAMHKDDLSLMKDKLSTWFIGWMGGPQRYSKRFGPAHMPTVHEPYDITEAAADAWLLCMRRALEEVAPREPPDFVDLLMERMDAMARMLVK